MPDVRVDHIDPEGNVDGNHTDIDQTEFDKGPPEVSGTEFSSRPQPEKLSAWQAYLRNGGSLNGINEARDLAKKIRRGQGINLDAQNVAGGIYGPAPLAVQEVVYSSLGDAGREPEWRTVPDHEWQAGPPDAEGARELGFDRLDHSAQSAKWRAFLESPAGRDWSGRPAEARKHRILQDNLRQLQSGNPPELRGRIRGLFADEATGDLSKRGLAAALGAAGALIGLVWGGVSLGKRLALEPATNVKGSVSTDPDTGQQRITVTWDAPTSLPPGMNVKLIGDDAPQPREITVEPEATSAVFTELTPDQYTAEVISLTYIGLPGPCASSAKIPVTAAAPNPPETQPLAPVSVMVTQDISSVTNKDGLNISWVVPETQPAGTTYVATLTGINPATAPVMHDAGEKTSWRVDISDQTDATYQAAVTAKNGKLTAGPTISDIVQFTAASPQTPKPDAPTNVSIEFFLDENDDPKATVHWDPPATGPMPIGYRVTLSGGSLANPPVPINVDRLTAHTFSDTLVDGTYTASVVAYNANRDNGPAATATAVLDKASVDPDVDWAMVIGPAEIARLKSLTAPMVKMEQAALFAKLLTLLEDQANDHGGVATYEEQLDLARLMTVWIAVPVDPTDRFKSNTAIRLAAETPLPSDATETFPTSPPAASSPWNDEANRLEIWKVASTLKTPNGMADVVTRHKFFGLVRALELYLGVTPS